MHHGKAVKHPRKKPNIRPGSHVRDPIPVEPVRRIVLTAMQERGLGWSDVASLAGQERRNGQGWQKADTSWVQRRLGLKPDSVSYKRGKQFRSQPHEFINRDIAVRLVRAVGEFPCDVVDPDTGEALL